MQEKIPPHSLFVLFQTFLEISALSLTTSCVHPPRIQPPVDEKYRSIGDGGFVSGQPCGPPCFLNIKPSITTSNDAKGILQGQSFGKSCVEYDYRPQGGSGVGIQCQNAITVSFESQIVDQVYFRPASHIALKEVISKYGLPDRILVSNASLLPDEPFWSYMTLYYDRLNAVLDLPDQYGNTFMATPNTLIYDVIYFSTSGYEYFSKLFVSRMTTWRGFGAYQAVFLP